MNPNQNPGGKNPMPNDTWPITADDKVMIRDLGGKLQSFLADTFKGEDSVHVKIVVGAFNYIMDLQTQKTKLIGDDYIIADKSVIAAGLTEKIQEPFAPDPVAAEPTIEEKRAHFTAELAKLDVEEASVAPSASELPERAPVVSPAGEAVGPGAVTENPTTPLPAAEPKTVAETPAGQSVAEDMNKA